MTVKRKDIVKKKLKAVSISIIYFSVTNYVFDHRKDGYGNTGHLVVIVSYILKLCDLIFSNILASF